MKLLKIAIKLMLLQYLIFSVNIVDAQSINSELAYLHTDRNVYVAGESIFYKLYILNNATYKCSDNSKIAYIVIRSIKNNSVIKIHVKIDKGLSNGRIILPDSIATGYYQILAYTSAIKNLGETFYFKKEIFIANRFDKLLNFNTIDLFTKDTNLVSKQDTTLNIKTDKNEYGVREKVNVNISNFEAKANVSVSVYEEPQIKMIDETLVGAINNQKYTLSNNLNKTFYTPETKSKILRGTVVDSKTNDKVKNSIVLLSCLDTIPNLQYAITDSQGLFQMLLSEYYNGKELFLTIKNVPENEKWLIKIEDDFELTSNWNPLITSFNNKENKDFITKSQNITYVNKVYSQDNILNVKELNPIKVICPKLYNCLSTIIFPADYISLPDFLEITVEILAQVRIVKEDGKFAIKVFNTLLKEFNKSDPAIFLDGVYVDDINKIIKLGSNQIQKIEIVDTERAFGDLVFSGVISIISKDKEIIRTKPTINSLRVKNMSFSNTDDIVNFNSYIPQNKHIPFVKQLLYWHPNLELNVNTSTNFEFYTSDNIANFLIHVEGITEDGRPISNFSRIKVTEPINVNDK